MFKISQLKIGCSKIDSRRADKLDRYVGISVNLHFFET